MNRTGKVWRQGMKSKIKLVLIQGLNYANYIVRKQCRHVIPPQALNAEQVEYFRVNADKFIGKNPDEPRAA